MKKHKREKSALHLPLLHPHALLMQRCLIPKYTRRRRVITTPRAALHKVFPVHIIFPIFVRDAQIRGTLNATQIQAIVAIDLAESRAAHIRRIALGPVSQVHGVWLVREYGGSGVRVRARRAVELFGAHVALFSLSEADDEGGHGHFNVELDNVDDGVELDVYDLVFEEHEADEEGVHGDGYDHELAVEAYEGRVFGEAVLFH